jgi:hypothetical protein
MLSECVLNSTSLAAPHRRAENNKLRALSLARAQCVCILNTLYVHALVFSATAAFNYKFVMTLSAQRRRTRGTKTQR